MALFCASFRTNAPRDLKYRALIKLTIFILLKFCEALLYQKPFENASIAWLIPKSKLVPTRDVVSLGHQEGRRVFWRGPNCLNYVQHIFPGDAKNNPGFFFPLRSPRYGPGLNTLIAIDSFLAMGTTKHAQRSPAKAAVHCLQHVVFVGRLEE